MGILVQQRTAAFNMTWPLGPNRNAYVAFDCIFSLRCFFLYDTLFRDNTI